MSNKHKAVEELKKLSRSFQGLISLADELEHVASLEQAAKESELRIQDMVSKEQEVKDKYDLALKKIEDANKEASDIVEKSKEEGEKVFAFAQKKGDELLSLAEEKVKALELALDKKANDVDAKVIEAGKVIAALDIEIKEKSDKVEALNKELAVIKAKLGA